MSSLTSIVTSPTCLRRDSGNETLFYSDEGSPGSPRDLLGTPENYSPRISPHNSSGDETETGTLLQETLGGLEFDTKHVGGPAPPNIQPYSGVLEKGKIVIRPIAFKPTAHPPPTRNNAASRNNSLLSRMPSRLGERYGSTPILTRPGSRLTLYGSSSDVRSSGLQTSGGGSSKFSCNSYSSLDRHKLRSNSGISNGSPLGSLCPLSSMPSRLHHCDSFESVNKSPMSLSHIETDSTSLLNTKLRQHRRSVGIVDGTIRGVGGGSLLDLTPSPSDSGVSDLEAALRDRDSELQHLRQTMEHNEQVIFRVYQEKERAWERELRRLQTLQERRARAGTAREMRLEQMLLNQNQQAEQEQRRLGGEVHRATLVADQLRRECTSLGARLEQTEWALCQKTGELSLLKAHIKDYQNEQTTKCQEMLQIRNENRDIREQLENTNEEKNTLQEILEEKNSEINRLKNDVQQALNECIERDIVSKRNHSENEENSKLKTEIKELRAELSDLSLSEYGDIQPGRGQKIATTFCRNCKETNGDSNKILNQPSISELKQQLEGKCREIERERLQWAQEKEKVLKYQRQLQMNYVQMYRKARSLETEVESLTIELELDKTGVKKLPLDITHQTINL